VALAATLAALLCVTSAAVLGVRLLWLFLARGAPTGLLGIALLLGGAPAHALALLIVAAGAPPSAGLWQLAYAFLYVSAGIAGTCVMRFTIEVFYPRSRSLSRANAVVAGAFALAAATAPFTSAVPRESAVGLASLVMLVAIFTWAARESFGHWAMYRRAKGLDVLVVDRFRLWGIAALANVAVVTLLLCPEGGMVHLGAAALAGSISSLALWLALVPPRSYVRRLHGRARAHGAQARLDRGEHVADPRR
jgi:hypothetical protein